MNKFEDDFYMEYGKAHHQGRVLGWQECALVALIGLCYLFWNYDFDKKAGIAQQQMQAQFNPQMQDQFQPDRIMEAIPSPKTKEELKEDAAREAYIEKYANVAVTEMEQYGIPASIKLAQAILESKAGRSGLAVKNNNHFGIKCFSKKCQRGHCSNFTDDTHKDFFIKYESAWGSYRAHSKFLKGGSRYAFLFEIPTTDYKAWAHGLKKAGYATKSDYAECLIRIINLYNLDRFDR